MAVIFRCDGCKRDHDRHPQLRRLEIKPMPDENEGPSSSGIKYDLCERCITEVRSRIGQLNVTALPKGG
jgi:hypothetical protein